MSHAPNDSAPPWLRLGDADEDLLAVVAAEARASLAGGVVSAVRLAGAVGARAVLPGGGRSADYLSVLATIAAVDLTLARVTEPHLDALAILHQAGAQPGVGAYGVYAAERPGLPAVEAEHGSGSVVLSGTKPWCSLAGALDRALVTATEGGRRRLYDIDLHARGVRPRSGAWVSRGLAEVDSGDIELDSVAADAVGEAGWYLSRPGFAWGGIGVAACWFGGAVGVASALLRAAERRDPDQLASAAIGEADRLLWAARTVLETAATRIDEGRAAGSEGALLAARVRGVVADSAERVIAVVGHALGPAPLTFDEEHARRVADLTVYLRQHHAERDDARVGEMLLETKRTGA